MEKNVSIFLAHPVCLFELMEYKVQNMGLLGGLSWNVTYSCVIKENIQLEYGQVTPQISPNLIMSTNI